MTGDHLAVALLGWLWLGSPFVVIALISHDRRLLGQVAAHQTGCLAAGWTGVVMMFLGVALMPALLGAVMFWLGTPLAGLAVWWRRDEGDDEGGDGPDVPPIDWDEFQRSFWSYARRRSPGSRPRTPTVH